MKSVKGGQFICIRLLGTGAFGMVWLAKNHQGQLFAIKEIENRGESALVESQLDILTKLQPHPNVVRFYQYFVEDSTSYCRFEFCERNSLADLLRNQYNQGMPQSLALALLLGILRGVAHIHNLGIVHRDIKPANILLGEGLQPKISDFGFSKSTSQLLTSYCGTPMFMAPEILLGSSSYSEKCDIFSIGVMLYKMVFIDHPYGHFKNINEITKIYKSKPQIVRPKKKVHSPEIMELIAMMLHAAPQHRADSATLLRHPLLTALEQLQAEKGGYSNLIEYEVRRLGKGVCTDLQSNSVATYIKNLFSAQFQALKQLQSKRSATILSLLQQMKGNLILMFGDNEIKLKDTTLLEGRKVTRSAEQVVQKLFHQFMCVFDDLAAQNKISAKFQSFSKLVFAQFPAKIKFSVKSPQDVIKMLVQCNKFEEAVPMAGEVLKSCKVRPLQNMTMLAQALAPIKI